MTAVGDTSWSEFAKAILEEASRTASGTPWFKAATKAQRLIARRVQAITTGEYHAAARRPAYSVLSNLRLKEAFGFELPAWSSQLQAVFAQGASTVESH